VFRMTLQCLRYFTLNYSDGNKSAKYPNTVEDELPTCKANLTRLQILAGVETRHACTKSVSAALR
jgi:hypothetical protein